MAWFTATPVSFAGNSAFFSRDSGLICKALQRSGIKCKSVMPLPKHPGDLTEDLIRTDIENLTQPKWWREMGADRVVLYSWGHYKYRQIAEATHGSGAKVFVNLDSAGIVSPRSTPRLYVDAVIGRQMRANGPFLGLVSGAIRVIGYYFYMPLIQEPGRIAHLRAATAIGCVSPNALALWRIWARTYAPDLVERMHLVPNPVADYLEYDGTIVKQDNVIAIGRWDDEEIKRPKLLAATVAETIKRRDKTEFHIYGHRGTFLESWHGNLDSHLRKRVHLHGQVSHEELMNGFMSSRIGLCSSSHEGSHVASEEALCAGASIVAPFRNELTAMPWYISRSSGQLSIDDSWRGLSETLLLELEVWDRGQRDPVAISSYWHSILSASSVARKIKELLE